MAKKERTLYPDVDSRMTPEQEQTAQDILARKGVNIDWTTGTIQAKHFVGSGEGLWDVGEGTGTGPKGEKGDKGDKGEDGKDFKYEDFTDEQLEDLVGPEGPQGEKGEDGAPGKDVNPGELSELHEGIAKNRRDINTNSADIAAEKVRNNEQDVLIEENANRSKANAEYVGTLEEQINNNSNDIVELEEELEAIAPTFERGHWLVDHTATPGNYASYNSYYLMGETEVAKDFADTKKLYIHVNDNNVPSVAHTFNDVVPGHYVELFEPRSAEFLLAKITSKKPEGLNRIFEVDVIKSQGGPAEAPPPAPLTASYNVAMPGGIGRDPGDGNCYFTTGAVVTPNFKDAAAVYVSTNDMNGDEVNLEAIKAGQLINLSSANGSGSYTVISTQDISGCYELLLENIEGTGTVADDDVLNVEVILTREGTHDVEGTRVKFFDLAESTVDLDTYMPKSGGTFTGNVKVRGDFNIDTGICIIKGKNTGIGTNFSVQEPKGTTCLRLLGDGLFTYKKPPAFDNYAKEQVATLEDVENVEAVFQDYMPTAGGTFTGTVDFNQTVTYAGDMTQANHMVTKKYVDDNGPHILRTNPTAPIKFVEANSLNFGEWSLSENNVSGENIEIYLYKLNDTDNNTRSVKDYTSGKSTEVEIRESLTGNVVYAATLTNMRPSSFSAGDVTDTCKATAYEEDFSFVVGNDYHIVVRGLAKK